MPSFIAILKFAEIKYEKRFLLSFIIFVEVSPCWVALDSSELFMILFMHSGLIKPKKKLLMESMFPVLLLY